MLVAYTTNAGSTVEVAQAIGETLGQDGTHIDVRHTKDIESISAYDAVLVGGPMIMGWHREAVRFVKRNQQALSQIPVAYFITAMSLTRISETGIDPVPVFEDPALSKPPADAAKLSFKERYTTVSSYLGPVFRRAPLVKPVGIAFFAGKVDYGKMNILQMMFVMLVIGAQPGDRRNWDAIREWATGVRPALLGA